TAPQYNLTVMGHNFVSGSVVQWNGTNLVTQYVNDTTVQAAVPYTDIATPTTANITVFNPTVGGGGGVSNAVSFAVVSALAALTRLAPAAVTAGGADLGVVVEGEGLYSGSVVNWDGSPGPTTFTAHNALIAKIPAADIAQTGTAHIPVVNPAPGGGTSNA